ncbi:hypothetical protein SAMN04488134_105201 [Amphibacillus marinus]|uniref:2',3'-cyclic-nucleotide 2'-phosphodiesterase/5'-or 3'-nucleotidase, 5'-nucleotidase family n=1 Tax=Amphibacillus marinus TaxID=872970 RepID=A0A1H8NC09_9BACI|nr:5'-nucleotidase C-terminal domain-containing protein [Amphibacillus marinus]SEO27117.1 hypothetical protein SAMN04488134_105201 [Amphibacillus marinus]
MLTRQVTNKFTSLFLTFLLLFTLLLGSYPLPVQAEDSEKIELTVLHTNDIHAKINDFGKIAAYIEAEREAATHSLYLDAGDIFSGNPVVDLQYGYPIISLLNQLDLQAMAIGNHEFDYGQEETVKRMNQSIFPWLSANTVVTDQTEVEFPQPEPYYLFELDGLTVGVFSLTETPPSTALSNIVGLEFNDPIETAKEYAYLADETDILIALTHIGYNVDRQLAEAVDFFDLIIGGHSHTTLNQPAIVNGTPIAQTGANGTNIGNITLSYDPVSTEVELVSGSLQSVANLTAVNEEVEASVNQFNAEMEDLLSEEIGYTESGLNRSGNVDSSLGNFWTDAIRHYTGADIALTNNGGIRANIPVGPITVNDIYTIEPFANEIMKFEMTGAAIKEVISYSYSRRNTVDLQTAGLHYTILTNNTGRFVDAELYVDGEPIEDEQTYQVAVGDYIGTGGSGYDFQGTVIEALSGLMTEAMITYANHLTENGQAINYNANERIAIEVTDAPIEGDPIGATENGLSAENNKIGDSGLGNLYTDAIRSATDADFALLNGSSVTGTIPAGVITDSQIEFLDQFGNQVEVVETNLARLKEVILEQSNYHGGVDLQSSGLHYQLIKQNNRFIDVELTWPDGSPLDEEATFAVAYNDYMHGSSFYNLGTETMTNDNQTVWETVVAYVSNQADPIDYQEGSRITINDLGSEQPGDDDYISVAEAIANNQGEATVQGYIVGTMTGQFDGDFVATNLMLADSPNERNMDRILPIQLPNSAIRTALNLVDHPENLGKPIQITGDLELYFSVPGLRNPSTFQFVEEEATPEPELLTISEAREQADGEQVKLNGIVTSDSGSWGGKGFYLQDETAGIYVFQSDLDIAAGSIVQLVGEKSTYNGELQISNLTQLTIIGDDRIPDPQLVTPAEIGPANEAELVTVEGVTLSNLTEINDFGTFEFLAEADGETVLVRVDNRTGLVFSDFDFEAGDIIDVTGISSQFNGAIQLKPRGASDIVIHEEDEQLEPEDPEDEGDPETEPENPDEEGDPETEPENPDEDDDPETELEFAQVTADWFIEAGEIKVEAGFIEQLADSGVLTVDITELDQDVYTLVLATDQLQQLLVKQAYLEIITTDLTITTPLINFSSSELLAFTIKNLTEIDNPISQVYDLTITNQDGLVSQFSEEAIGLSFAVNQNAVSNTEKLGIYYLTNEDTWERIGGSYTNGRVTGSTDHFTTFTVLADDDSAFPIDDDQGLPTDQNDDQSRSESGEALPNTATAIFNWILIGVVIVGIGTAVLLKKRKMETI